MIILLTGEPFAGRSTAAKTFADTFPGPVDWVVATEVTGSDGIRVGYEVVNSAGGRHWLGHQTAIKSDLIVGRRRYRIDTSAIDEFFTRPLQLALKHPSHMLVLDEIGNMQRLSPNFLPAVTADFDKDIDQLATVRSTEDWAQDYLLHPHAANVAVTLKNRDILPQVLVTIFGQRALLAKLSRSQRRQPGSLLSSMRPRVS